MKLTILQSNFVKAINQVSRVVGTRTTLPVLGNILISAEKGKITLSGTDLEVAITTQATGKIEEDGRLTIPARLLSDFIVNNNDESISLKVSEDNKVHLSSDHFKANINGVSAEEFPTIPSLSKESFCNIKRTDFSDAIKKVLIAPANDETRPVLAGIYFEFKDKTLTLAATDSYRLAEKKLTLESDIAEKKFIVPARTMNEVARLMGTAENAENIAIAATENQVSFVIGETEVVSRLIEGNFPNYSQIIPASSKITATADHQALTNAVKMTSLFAKDAANNIKIKVVAKMLQISSAASEAGDATSEVEAETSGGEVEIAFNSKYVLEVLQVISDDKVVMQFNDEASAGVIKSPKEDSFVYIVMPLRIDN